MSVATDDPTLRLVLLIGHIAPANPVPKRSMNRRRPIAKSSLQIIRQLWSKLFLKIRFGGLQPVQGFEKMEACFLPEICLSKVVRLLPRLFCQLDRKSNAVNRNENLVGEFEAVGPSCLIVLQSDFAYKLRRLECLRECLLSERR